MGSDRFVFAHLSDAHVGAWPRHPSLRAALRQAVLRAIDRATEQRVEFLLISGDLFHTAAPDPSEAAPVAAALRRLGDTGARIYAIYGSHDYVAHRTSWLDVLAEAGVFVRVAADSVRAEGTRWTLPYVIDPPTGAVIAGISGRPHSLDREYFRTADSEAFRSERGFRIFQFHAAVEDYLPAPLRGQIAGVRREDLPPGCQYYAGGHIHCPYLGEGPDGGLLVNPGTIFGTSVTDLDYQATYRGRHGLALVHVEGGRPSVTIYDPCPDGKETAMAPVDLSGMTPDEMHRTVLARLEREVARVPKGSPLVLRLEGSTGTHTLSEIDLPAITRDPRFSDHPIEILASEVVSARPVEAPVASESEIERAEFERAARAEGGPSWWADPESAIRGMQDLLGELSTEPGEGESRADYEEARVAGARAILGMRGPGGRDASGGAA
ncbi:MAG: DNA repair exonuclease [Thermoplasmata archaeon]